MSEHDTAERLIDVVHENRSESRNISDQLWFLASAFRATGNATVADRLSDIAEHVEAMSKRVSDAFGRDITEQLYQSEQATMNMVSAALAGIVVGARS